MTETPTTPAWTYFVPTLGPIISGLIAFAGVWLGLQLAGKNTRLTLDAARESSESSLRQAEKNTSRTLDAARESSESAMWQKANELELRDIENRLGQFYYAFQVKALSNHQLAQDLRSRQPKGYRMLVCLFDPQWLPGLPPGDKKIVELVCENAAVLEKLIDEKGGLMDPELLHHFGRAKTHFRILQLAFKRELGTDPTEFKKYVYPIQLDVAILAAISRLQQRAAALRSDLGKAHGPIRPLVLPEDAGLDAWPDPDGRLEGGADS